LILATLKAEMLAYTADVVEAILIV